MTKTALFYVLNGSFCFSSFKFRSSFWTFRTLIIPLDHCVFGDSELCFLLSFPYLIAGDVMSSIIKSSEDNAMQKTSLSRKRPLQINQKASEIGVGSCLFCHHQRDLSGSYRFSKSPDYPEKSMISFWHLSSLFAKTTIFWNQRLSRADHIAYSFSFRFSQNMPHLPDSYKATQGISNLSPWWDSYTYVLQALATIRYKLLFVATVASSGALYISVLTFRG